MATQRTFVMLKPDAVQRGLIGEILGRFEKKGLKLIALKLLSVSAEQARQHYAVHEGKPFYDGLISYIRSSPVIAAALEGPEAVAQVRALVGATRPNEAAPGTIRGDLGVDISNNLVHASDSTENAECEIGVYFSAAELVDLDRSVENWISGAAG
jgi:nucleoside-diphosphate kinase